MEMLKLNGVNGRLLCKDGKIKIIRDGLLTAKREKVIPASNISGVEIKKPGVVFNGYIQIQIAGQHSTNSLYELDGGIKNAVSDENTVVFRGDENLKIAQAIQKHILDFNAKPVEYTPAVSDADEIMKFKKLMDEGIITLEEFNKKKEQILSK